VTTTFGDLGCSNVDVDKWRLDNRVPLFPGKVNRWVLVRTLRDNPTPDDLKSTLAATFMKWFEGTTLDPVLVYNDTTRSATADLIKLERVSKDRLSFADTARRREELPGVTPTLRSGEYVWMEVSFAYRGEQKDMAWPVRTGAIVQLQSSARCPVEADWILDSVATPKEDAPPEMSSSGKAWDVITDTTAQASAGAMRALWLPFAVAGAGLLLFLLARRG
jgi:hypothetical protein